MRYTEAKVDDRIIVHPSHRLGRNTGKIVAIGDNKHAQYNHYHIEFDGEVFGAIQNKEIWLCRSDFDVLT
jgi:hypothetical protein